MDALRLYIAGKNIQLKGKIEKLKGFLQQNIFTDYEFQIIDVLQDPIAANTDNIFVTPTLIWTSSKLSKRIVGDISDPKKIAILLGLS